MTAIPDIVRTAERGVSTRVDRASSSLSSKLVFLAGICVFLFSVALTIRSYMPCPFWDEWTFLSDIAAGARPSSWHWLWSQHNEHRLVITRLLVWLDYAAFGAKNVSLFTEMYLFQILQCLLIFYALEKSAEIPISLRRILQGLFAFCLFHPNQAENLTWAFQVSFVLCFALGTAAVLTVAFWDRIPARSQPPILLGLALAPFVASLNLIAGLLVAPTIVGFACLKRFRAKTILSLAAVYALSFIAYLHGYENSAGSSPIHSLAQPKSLFLYVLTFFDQSWRSIFRVRYHFASIVSLIAIAFLSVRILRNPSRATNFELFCLAECSFLLTTTVATAAGRLQFGIGQALAGRYQTPAMLYWAAFLSLSLIAIWRKYPARLRILERSVMVAVLFSLLLLPFYWKRWARIADLHRNACVVVTGSHYNESSARILSPATNEVKQGATMLRSLWHR